MAQKIYISASDPTSAVSLRWYRSNTSLRNRPCRSFGSNSSFPTGVISVRGFHTQHAVSDSLRLILRKKTRAVSRLILRYTRLVLVPSARN